MDANIYHSIVGMGPENGQHIHTMMLTVLVGLFEHLYWPFPSSVTANGTSDNVRKCF